jgi:hypothetical protein
MRLLPTPGVKNLRDRLRVWPPVELSHDSVVAPLLTLMNVAAFADVKMARESNLSKDRDS